ncbi:MAG: hypothetical protein EOP84_20045, partial [Verrucomicrobiaceae bacterium]
ILPALPQLGLSDSSVTTSLTQPGVANPSGERHWLANVLSPQKVTPQQQAILQLETAGMPFTADGFVRAVATGHRPLVDLFLTAGMDINAVASDGRTALLSASLAKQWELVDHFLKLGASVKVADADGLTPLMAAAMANRETLIRTLLSRGAPLNVTDTNGHGALHYAVATRSIASLETLLAAGANSTDPCCENRNLYSHAVETRDWKIVGPIMAFQASNLEWTDFTRQELTTAVKVQDAAKTKLLLSKHPAAPAPEGHAQPLLAHAMLEDDFKTFRFLLDCGASPDTPLNSPVQKDFSKRVSQGYMQHYLNTEEGMTVLMLAAGMGRMDYVQTLLNHGAKRNIVTKKYKMPALLFATRSPNYQVAQLLIGNAPKPEELRIEISISSQRASVIKNGIPVISTSVSTGRSGFATPRGDFVVTDKRVHHVSNLYDAKMPFFMRLSARDFGLHQGVVPGYPASHGCIRVPAGMARKLFGQIPVGTLVSIR